jgi:hypothetical protein
MNAPGTTITNVTSGLTSSEFVSENAMKAARMAMSP